MDKRDRKILSFTRLTEEGQIVIPDEYRRALSLSGDSPLALMQVGDVLVLAPVDDELAAIISRLESRAKETGIDVDDLIAEANKAREEIVRNEFGTEDQ